MRLKILIMPFLAVTFIIFLTGCSLFDLGNSEKPVSQESSSGSDDIDEEDPEYPVSAFGAKLDSRPGIVVSLAPSLTDKVFDLGLGDRLEGVSDYCGVSGSAAPVRCGTAQLPDLEEIEKLSPHLVLTETELSENDLIAIQQMGAEIAVIPHADSVKELMENYMAIARLFEGERTGAALGGRFCENFQGELDMLAQNAPGEIKNAVYLRVLSFTVATGDTLENELMETIGLNNIAKDYTNWTYPEEDATGDEGKRNFASIDIIYCDKRSVTIKMLEQSAFYKGLDAVLKDRYLYIDSSAFERQSLGMLDELTRMQQYANGEISGSAQESSSES